MDLRKDFRQPALRFLKAVFGSVQREFREFEMGDALDVKHGSRFVAAVVSRL
jgi:hypothetical protein